MLDAMGCQGSMAQKIREKDADYVLILKGNQSSFFEGVTVHALNNGKMTIPDFYKQLT